MQGKDAGTCPAVPHRPSTTVVPLSNHPRIRNSLLPGSSAGLLLLGNGGHGAVRERGAKSSFLAGERRRPHNLRRSPGVRMGWGVAQVAAATNSTVPACPSKRQRGG